MYYEMKSARFANVSRFYQRSVLVFLCLASFHCYGPGAHDRNQVSLALVYALSVIGQEVWHILSPKWLSSSFPSASFQLSQF